MARQMNRFKELRLKAELEDVETAASLLECSINMIYAMESDNEKVHRNPSPYLAKKMCDAYKCTMNDIYPIECIVDKTAVQEKGA